MKLNVRKMNVACCKVWMLAGLVWLSPVALSAQNVIKVVKSYVLIDAGPALGKAGDKIDIYRVQHSHETKVGQIEIIKFNNGRCAARIVKGKIREGDYVKMDNFDVDSLFDGESGGRSQTAREKKRQAQLGLSASVLIPTGDMTDAFAFSPTVSAMLSIPLNSYDMIIEFAYPFMQLSKDYQEMVDRYGVDISASLAMLLCYDRYRLDDRAFLDLGGGVYFPGIKASAGGSSDSVTESKWGICVGPTFLWSENFTIYGKFHAYSGEGAWVRFITAGAQIWM